MASNIEILRTEKLTKHFKCQKEKIFISIKNLMGSHYQVAVQNIDFSLYQGEILGITGPVHSGKSTLLKLLAGRIAPTSGLVLYENTPLDQEELKKIATYVSVPELTVNHSLTLMENIIQNFGNEERSRVVDMAEKLLETFGIKEYEFRELKKLPCPIKTMLIPLIALISTKPILCIDQPFMYLDASIKDRFFQELRKMADSGVSIIMTSSSKEELGEICDRIVEIAPLH